MRNVRKWTHGSVYRQVEGLVRRLNLEALGLDMYHPERLGQQIYNGLQSYIVTRIEIDHMNRYDFETYEDE